MKGKISLLTRKVFASIIALAMSIPPTAFANNQAPHVYDANSSVMGLAKTKEEPTSKVENTDETKLVKDLGTYELEITSKLDESLEKISYTIKAKKKQASKPTSKEEKDLVKADEAKDDLSLTLTKTPTSNIKNIKLGSANIATDTNEPDFKEDLASLVIKSKANDEIIYELSADVNKAKDQRSYDLILGLKEADKEAKVFAYNLKAETGVTIVDNQTVDLIKLVNKEEKSTKAKGKFTKEGILGGLFASHDSITWTDYILNEKDSNKEITYNFDLDSNQDPTGSKINLDYYEWAKNGFEIKKEFSQTIDFAKKVKFEIPKGYIAKLNLKTQVSKKNTKVKSYSLNNSVLKNPIYIEGNEDENKKEEEDPLPVDKKPSEKPADKPAEDKKSTTNTTVDNPTDQNKKDNQPAGKESSTEIKIDDKTAEDKKEKNSETQIVATDSSGNEVKVEERNKPKEENNKPQISALILNKDSLIAKLKAENKLTSKLETAIGDLTDILNSYNEEKITDQELKDFTKSLAERNQIAKADLKSYLESILSGLNKQTNKAANINYDEIITYAYPEKKESEPLVEIKSDEKLLANSDSQEQKENQNKETLSKIPSAKKEDDEREDRESFEENSVAKAFDKDLAKLKEAAENEDKKEKGVFEGLKSLVGQTDLQKADKELKKALANENNTIEDIQTLLDKFEEKYKLSRADQAKLLEDNGDAIRALIEKHKDSNIRPLMLFGAQNINGLNLDGKKFHVRTIFQTSSAAGPIQPYQFFDIHLDKKLTVNDPSSLKDITYNHRVVAKPQYIKEENKIRYQIQGVIPENLNISLNIPVDYNQENISLDPDGTFTVTNKVSGMGIVNPPKDLLPVKVDKDGNIKGTIIEPGRNDVNQIIEPDDSNYKVNVDALGNPEIKDGKITGYNWKIHVSSDTNLSLLGFDANFTTVKGSGLGEIQNLKINNKDSSVSTNAIAGKLGITDSKHYKHEGGDRDLNITFYTPVINTQESYMLDLSFLVKDKLSAKRLIVTSGYSPAAVSDDTPTRIGMNNRTSIMGEFSSNFTSKWTVTDAISTGDDKDEEGKKKTNPLPLATRTANDQTVATSKYAIYQIDTTKGSTTYGKMVVKVPETDLHGIIPDQGTATNEDHTVGTIAAYEYDTKLDSPTVNKPKMSYTLGGVEISKEVDLQVEQDWILDKEVKIPKQHIEAVNANNHDQVLGNVELPAAKDFSRTRRFVIPNVKVWEIGEKGKATRLTPKIKQDLPKVAKIEFKQENGSTITKDYKFIENYNYYKNFSREYYLHNRGTEQVNINYGNFTLVKTDSQNPKEKLQGARFKMLHGPEVITDENGEAKFSNLEPGSYTLIETKAPEGYKLNDGDISISVDKEGRVTASGKNTSVTGGSTPTTTIKHNVYPDYMNAMHYGSIDSEGNITTYIFLKALGNTRGGSTNRDTRVNINLANINNPQYQVYDISPFARGDIQKQMNLQTLNSTNLNPVLNKEGWEPIRGRQTNNGYTIGFPKDRFGGGDDWGFLIEVKGQAQQGQQPSLSYDWITDKQPDQAKLTNNNVALSSTTAGQDTVVTVTNVKFPRKPVEVMKVDQNQKPLQGATFVIRNSNGDPISTKISGPDGKVDFGEQPVGTYTIEEIESPDEYQESPIVFDVTVDEAKQVFYKVRFKNGEGTPVRGKDYWIENEVVADQDTKAQVIEVVQSIELSENNPGELGERKGIWEAYRYESYTYKAHVVVNNSQPKKRFEIQFDPNLDFTQYVNKIPSIKNNQGVEIADAYFDYDTNLLTYVFNENSDGGKTDFDFVIDGIIPSKYYAPNNGTYNFVIKAAPGNSTEFSKNSNPILPFSVQAYYDYYDVNDGGSPAQLYYFRDVYKGDDDNWYVKAIAYYNPLASRAKESRTLYFDWFSTNWRGDIRIARWPANGNLPAFKLNDVKIYRSLPTVDPENPRLINNKKNMPLSMGVRPETDPGTYELVYSSPINPDEYKSEKQNQITLTYDPSEIKTTGTIDQWSPLKLDMPSISSQNEGYVIEQTFKVTDLEKFRNMFRAFYMTNKKAPPRQESAFASKVNTNIAVAEQSKKEIPKYYSQKVMMANNKYTPAKFRIRKRDLSDSANYLKGAVFTLTDKDERIIARSTGEGGILTFENLKPGNYRLEETNAPKGFIKSNKTWSVNVASDSTVTITEIGLNSTGANYVGQDLMIEVSNKPFGKNFVVYKRGDDRKPLAGAKFTIKEENSEEVFTTGESNQDGVVDFGKKLVQGKRYILEESEAPIGYKKLDKKWVLVVGKDSVEVYDYIDGPKGNTNPEVNVSLLGEKGTRWVDVANRNFSNWTIYDHRWSGYAGGSRNPFKLGTRIIGINREEKYVIQRYVINPEGESVGPSRLEIHKELPEYTNSNWYDGTEEFKIFKLDKRVTENVEDIKLKNYTLTILDKIKAQKYIKPNNKNDSRMLINLPATDKPIIIDVKVPYDDERGGIGTGMDYYENYDPTNGSSKVYWKADHYESVSIIKDGDLVKAEGEAGNIQGAHVSDNSLDISNEKKRYNFEFKKIREKDPGQQTPDSVSGATFKLTGPYPSNDTKWSKSGEDGMVHFNNLIPGSYTLAEHAPAQGYEPADTTWTVTVGEDGKFHFKDNNVGKVNEDPNLQWQKADTSQDNPNRHNGYYTSNGSNGKIETKITEVNIKLGKFRQVYILNALPEKLKNPFFEIHAQEENRNLNLTNTKILSVKLVGSNSKPDRLEYIGADIKCDTKVYSKTNEKGDTYERIKLTPENLAGENKTVAVTIESDIPASGSIGTGMDFINFDKANHYWAAQWYDTLQDIKLNPIKGGGTSRSTYSVDGEGTNNYTKPTYYTNAPLLMKNVSGLVERNVALRKPQSQTYSNPLSTLAYRSAFFATDGLEIGDNLVGTPVGAGNLSQTSYNKDSSDANITVTAGDVNTTDGTRNINISVSPKDNGGQPGKETIIGNNIQMVFVIDRSKDFSESYKFKKGTLDNNINKLIYDIVQKAKQSNAEIDATFIEYDNAGNDIKGNVNLNLLALDEGLQDISYNMSTPSKPNGENVIIKDYLNAVGIKKRSVSNADGNKKLGSNRDRYFGQITNTKKNYDKRILIDVSNFATRNADKWNVSNIPSKPVYKYQAAEILWPFRNVGNPPHFDNWMIHVDQVNENENDSNVSGYKKYMSNNTANGPDSNNNILGGHFNLSLNTGNSNMAGVNNLKDFFDRNVITDDNFIKERIPAADDPNALLVKDAKIDVNLNQNVRLEGDPIADKGSLNVSPSNDGFTLTGINLKKGQTLNLSYKIGLDSTAQTNQDYLIHRQMLYTSANGNSVNLDNNLATRRNLEHFFVTLIANNGTGQTTRQSVNKGDYYTLGQPSFAPPSGQEFDVWLVYGQRHQPGERIQINEDTNVVALWKDKQVTPTTVTISFDGNGGQVYIDPVTLTKGSTYHLPRPSSFTPPANMTFDAWSVNGERKNPNDPIVVNDNTTVTALWKSNTPQPKKFNITTSVNDPKLGSVTVDKDKASLGDDVTVTVTPKDDTVEITDVNVGGTSIGPQLKNNKYTFKIVEANDVHISVTFNPIQVKESSLYAENLGTGTITLKKNKPASPGKAKQGDRIEVSVEPREGFYVDKIITRPETDITYTSATTAYFIMPGDDVTVDAIIKLIPTNKHQVKVTKPDHGLVTVDKQYAGFEETITLTAIADEGYELDRFIVTDANNDEVPTSANTFKMPNSAVTATAIFKKKSPPPDPNDPGDDVTDQLVTIPNKQAGIELKIFKKDTRGRPLEGGQFKLTKVDKNYQNPDKTFMLTAVSDKDGKVEFLDQTGKKAKLQKGYYTIEEVKPPTGYKQASSKWNVEVKDDKGKMHATYFGPEQTSVEYLISDKVNLGNTTNSNDEIGWASKIKNIDTNAGTFVQRIMIDLRGYKGTEKLNLQVVPKHKKEEYDRAGVSPDIVKEGVKTAYRTSYRINDPSPDLKAEDVLNSYDLSKNNVAMVNTARWRPFDWGFDEDQLNLEPGGVYFIDIEGYFDPAIITGTATKEKKVVEGVSTNVDPYNRTDITKDDLGKIALDFQLFKGERHFQQAVYNKDVPGKIEWKSFPKASYQAGAVAIAKTKPDGWSGQWGKNGKYENWKGLEGGRISPALPKKPYKSIETSADISSLYTANNDHNAKEIPKEGLELTNEEESYNITFSKHGRDDPNITDNNDDRITKNRLEGAIFRLEQKIGNDYVAMPGSYVSSAFNGFFGFRGLKPGRYRLVEVQAPAGYRPINDAVLYMTIAYEKEQINQATGEITPGRGAITLEYASGNGIVQYAPDDTKKYNSGKLVDFVTSGTAKNMGKIINEKPGKGKVTVKKTDEIGQALTGAKFRLVRVSKTGIQDEIDKKPQQGGNTIEGVYNGTVDKDGNLTFEQLPIGQYILEELEPAPGHKLTGQKWYFTVGGKELDPYSGPMERTGIDQSKNISMTSEMKVVRPNDEDETANEGNTKIHPNYGHMMKFDNKFTIKQGATISPGDFFVVKMTDKTDLKGIFNKEAISGLDIFADGVGTIAKADYDDEKGTITYTFTEYARTYQLLNFESTYVGHINLAKTKVSTNNVSVGFWMNEDESTKKTINVSYELGTKDATDYYGNNINLSSKITYFEPETGRFEHIIYINRDGKNSNGAQFVYKPGKNVSNLRYELFKVNNYYGKNYTMPPSYSVNYSNWFMTRVVNNYYNRTVNDYNPVYQSFNNDYYSTDPSLDRNDSYVVRITGNISDGEDKTAYTPEARLRRFNDYGYVYMWAKREDEVYSRLNTNEAKADLTISAINPRNKIIFRKTDQNYKTLAGAIFGLVKYKSTDDQTGKEIWEEVKGEDGQELTAKTGEDGLASFEKLPEGRYALVEKIAPKGYTRIETHILEFMVSKNGIITRNVKENGKAEDKEITEVVGTSPIGVINYKDIDFVKIDANSGKFLPGAKFKLWYKEKQTDKYRKLTNDEYSKQIYSDSDGKFKIHVTRNGYYALEEIESPRGYKKPDDVEFVREFKLENGRVLVLQKDPLKASYRVGNKGAMESRILSVDQDKKQFTQRIVLNPHGKEVTFDGPGTYLRFHGNGWKIIPHLSVGGKIKVALLPKDGKIDDLKPSDYIEVDASGRTTTPEVVSRYQIKGILDSLSSKAQKKLYKGPEEGKNNITTDATLVVEYTGQLTGSGENEKKAEIKQDIYFDLTYLDQMIYKLDLDEIQKNKPTYVEKSELRPVEVENTKLHEIKFRKVDAKVNEKTGKKDSLAGAEFKLLYRKKETEEVEGQGGKKELKPVEWTELHLYEKTIKNAGGGSEIERIWLPKGTKDIPEGFKKTKDTFTSEDQTGNVEFKYLLDPGYYAVQETKAPAGFALPLTENKIVKKFVIRDGELIMQLDEKKTSNGKEEIDHKEYVKRDDGYFYEKVGNNNSQMLLTNPQLSLDEYKQNKLTYVWSINPYEKEVEFTKPKLAIDKGALGKFGSLKVTATNDGSNKEYNLQGLGIVNGWLDLSPYLTPTKEGSGKTKTNLTIAYTVEMPEEGEEKEVKSTLVGMGSEDLVIEDKFKFDSANNQFQKNETNIYKKYVDANLVHTDKEGNLEVENRKVELPKALGTGNILTYTLAGLAVMLAGVFIYFKKKQAIKA